MYASIPRDLYIYLSHLLPRAQRLLIFSQFIVDMLLLLFDYTDPIIDIDYIIII